MRYTVQQAWMTTAVVNTQMLTLGPHCFLFNWKPFISQERKRLQGRAESTELHTADKSKWYTSCSRAAAEVAAVVPWHEEREPTTSQTESLYSSNLAPATNCSGKWWATLLLNPLCGLKDHLLDFVNEPVLAGKHILPFSVLYDYLPSTMR